MGQRQGTVLGLYGLGGVASLFGNTHVRPLKVEKSLIPKSK